MLELKLEKAIQGFLVARQAEGRSARTIKWYGANLGTFKRWLDPRRPEALIKDIKSDDVRDFFAEQRGEIDINQHHPFKRATRGKVTPNTLLGRFTTLSSFFNWAEREGLLEKNPVHNIQRPKIPKLIVPAFTQDEIKRLLAACDQLPDDSKLRARAIILLFLDTGVRCTELLTLTMANLNIDENRALVMGKGAKQRFVYFGKLTKQAVWRYISLARPEPMPGVDNLLLNHDGLPFSYARPVA